MSSYLSKNKNLFYYISSEVFRAWSAKTKLVRTTKVFHSLRFRLNVLYLSLVLNIREQLILIKDITTLTNIHKIVFYTN